MKNAQNTSEWNFLMVFKTDTDMISIDYFLPYNIFWYTWPNLFLIFPFQACAQYCALVTGIMKMVSAVAFLVGKAWSASWDMTNVKWLIALDMANVLMGNVFVPEDTLDQHASKVSNRKKKKTITDRLLGIRT